MTLLNKQQRHVTIFQRNVYVGLSTKRQFLKAAQVLVSEQNIFDIKKVKRINHVL